MASVFDPIQWRTLEHEGDTFAVTSTSPPSVPDQDGAGAHDRDLEGLAASTCGLCEAWDMAASQATSGRRVALPTAIAGLLGTLVGTVVGGLISLAAVRENIHAQEASNLRANRQQAYSVFFADAVRHIQLIYVDLADDNSIDKVEAAELEKNNLAVTRSYAAAVLVASRAVGKTLDDFNTEANKYEEAVQKGQGDTGARLNAALQTFLDTAKRDLGASGDTK